MNAAENGSHGSALSDGTQTTATCRHCGGAILRADDDPTWYDVYGGFRCKSLNASGRPHDDLRGSSVTYQPGEAPPPPWGPAKPGEAPEARTPTAATRAAAETARGEA